MAAVVLRSVSIIYLSSFESHFAMKTEDASDQCLTLRCLLSEFCSSRALYAVVIVSHILCRSFSLIWCPSRPIPSQL